LPDRIEKQIKVMETTDFDFVGTCADLIDENGVWGIRKTIMHPNKKDFLKGSQFIHPSIMIKRNSIVSANGYRVAPETLRTEDFDLFMRLYANGLIGMNMQESLLQYTESRGSYSKRKFKYRINEVVVRYKGYKLLDLMPQGYLYSLKPIIVGLIPSVVLRWIRKNQQIYIQSIK
jgi:hypothetical protein